MLDRQVAGLYFLGSVDGHSFGDLSSYFRVRVLPYLVPVFFLLDLPDLGGVLHQVDIIVADGGLDIPSDLVAYKIANDGCNILLGRFHIILLLDDFEDLGHVLLEVIEIGVLFVELVGSGFVDLRDDVVEHPHNQIVVIAALSVLEDEIALGEVVVAQTIQVINFLDHTLQVSVDCLLLGQGVLLLQVNKHLTLQVLVQLFNHLTGDVVHLVQLDQIVEDVHRAVYFGLFEGHLVAGETVEGYREGLCEQLGDPSFEGKQPVRGVASHWDFEEEVAVSKFDVFWDGRAGKSGRVGDGVALDLRGRSLHLFSYEVVKAFLFFLDGDELPANGSELTLSLLNEFRQFVVVCGFFAGVAMRDGFRIPFLEHWRISEIFFFGFRAFLVGMVDIWKLEDVRRELLSLSFALVMHDGVQIEWPMDLLSVLLRRKGQEIQIRQKTSGRYSTKEVEEKMM